MVAPLIVRNSFVPGRVPNEDREAREKRILGALQDATAYLLTSDRHGLVRAGHETRTLFDRRTDDLLLAVVRARLLGHIGQEAAFHRLTLSLHTSLFDYLVVEADAQRWTRTVLEDACAWLGRTPEWVAAVHRDTGVLHVHVVLGGADGRGRDVVLRPPFFAQMRQAGVHEAERMMAEKWGRLRRLTGDETLRRLTATADEIRQ